MSVKFTSRFDDAAPALRVGMMNGLTACALYFTREIRKTLSKRGTGRRYRVAKGRSSGRNLRARGWHTASKPGEPPAANTGTLRRSWTIKPVKVIGESQDADGFHKLAKKDRDSFVYTMGSNLVYARALEYGAPSRRLAPRFYVRPTLKDLGVQAPKIIGKQIQIAISRVGRQIGGMQ